MNLPKELTTVTVLSKTLAFIMFTTMPIIGFFFGMQYQETIDLQTRQLAESQIITPKRLPTPTPDVAVNWKTYTNDNLRISFKYPSDWKVPQETSLSVHFLKDPDMRMIVSACPGYSFSITKYDHLIDYYSSLKPLKPGIIDKEPTQIFEQTNKYGCYTKIIFVVRPPDKNYTPRLVISLIQKDTNPQVLDNILSTFKFTQ